MYEDKEGEKGEDPARNWICQCFKKEKEKYKYIHTHIYIYIYLTHLYTAIIPLDLSLSPFTISTILTYSIFFLTDRVITLIIKYIYIADIG
ncbi:hypothetical protein CLU79DRAFT_341496 [Phycomyces nitens]|nr:hypothetical protein CLU79DRAFT_341496 [Phycomyces nitens]